jgi:D-lactate dehydrogenase
MHNIIFYDTKEYERNFFENELNGKFNTFFRDYELLPETELSFLEKNAEIISVFTSSRLTKETLEKFEKLKLILTRSVGYSHIDIDYCNSKNIIVANTPHYGDYTVAEFSFGILLNLVRRICYGVNELKEGTMYPETFGTELFDKTIGIIGVGSIGKRTVKIAKGFSMNIICFDICQNEEIEKEFNVKYTDIDTLCKLSDIITLHAPLTVGTYHILDKNKISLMKENAVIVNTSRGELIDTEALYEALIENRIKGAALDVLEMEEVISNKRAGENLDLKNLRISLINNKLLHLKNVIATPHIAYDTKEAVNRILNMTMDTILEFERGVEIKNKI